MIHVLEPIDAIGREIERRFRQTEYDETALPEIAEDVLRATRPHERLSRDDILRWALSAEQLPPQRDLEAAFGEPPLTLFMAPRFYIEALFWLDGTTSVHQHGFSGAFYVLEGSSIHSRFSFETRTHVGQRVLVGQLQLLGTELLRPGDCRRIVGGRELTHSLFHLERPSVTLVVRTMSDPGAKPQFRYLYPHLALDPGSAETSDPLQVRRRQLLDLCAAIDADDYERKLAGVLPSADYLTAIVLLERAARYVRSPERLRALVAAMGPRAAGLLDALPAVLEHVLRTAEIVSLREQVTDPGQRLLLALMLNLHDRTAILETLSRALPGADPVDRVVGWLRDLTTPREGFEPPLGFEVDEISWMALEESVRGRSFEEFVAELAKTTEIGSEEPALRELWGDLRSIRVLQPLFA